MCLEIDYKVVFIVLALCKLHANMYTDLKNKSKCHCCSFRLSLTQGYWEAVCPPGQRVPEYCAQPHLPAFPSAPSSLSWPDLTSQPSEKPDAEEEKKTELCPCRAQLKRPMRERTMVASTQANTLLIGSQDGLSANVRRPSGLQTFVNAPRPSHHQSLKTNGRRPGALQQIPE